MTLTPEIAISIALGGWPPRYQEIDQLEAWYLGLQYELGGPWYREHKWTDERDSSGKYIPLAQRRPYDFGIAKNLVDMPTGFLFDEGRFPALLVEGDDAGAVAAEAWLRAVAEHVAMRVKMLNGSRIGGRQRSVFAYFKIVDGEPILDMHGGKYCTPTFERDGKTLKLVRKQYKCLGEHFARMGYAIDEPDKFYWYRHDFTPDAEIAYFPVKFEQGPKVPQFEVDEDRTVRHNLGFVPGVWMVNLYQREDGYDGVGTYEGEQVLTMIHLCNESLSQAHRATGHASDPQFVLEVDPEKGDPDPAIRSQTKGGVWMMPGKLSLVEMAGTGQKMALEMFDRYRALISDATSVTEVDPESISGKAQSAEALRVLYAGLIGFASLLRVCYGEQGLVPLCKIILRVLKATANTSINIDGVSWEGKEVERSAIPDRPKVRLEWGPWFAPTAADQQAMIASAASAVVAGLLSQETAVSVIAKLYGRDGGEELKKILAEREERMNEAVREQQALAEAIATVEGDEPEEEPGADE